MAPSSPGPLSDVASILEALGLTGNVSGVALGSAASVPSGPLIEKRSPRDGTVLGRVQTAGAADVEACIAATAASFMRVRDLPAPRRGEVVRALGDALRVHKEALGALISLETGKIRAEGEGEVQEMVDIADYAVGLSRMLGGRTLPSERPGHRLQEQWHPLGAVGVITAFNFPAAVWAWNALVAFVCGNSVLWKPSLKAPLTAVATQRIVDDVLARFSLGGALTLCIGADDVVGARVVDDARLPLISATGSTRMGRVVGPRVAQRFGRTLLELGGNNAVIVMPDADLALAVRAIVFGAVGTTGQRCTSTRRVLVHDSVAARLLEALTQAYAQVLVGDPLADGTLMGPLVDEHAVHAFQHAVARARSEGGTVRFGGSVLADRGGGCYVEPTLVESHEGMPMLREEVFAPILHVVRVRDLEHAIALNNDVPQGLSSSLFTNDFKSAERFLSARGSDCGIANINAGTSGAEIGGAFGGEKETGGGRESGSDSWKAYMRRQTTTINFSDELPLAQGIRFL